LDDEDRFASLQSRETTFLIPSLCKLFMQLSGHLIRPSAHSRFPLLLLTIIDVHLEHHNMIKLTLRLGGLAIVAILANCTHPAAPNYDGTLDTVNCDVIAGWAWNANDANKQISVNIFDGDSLIGTVKAEGLRPDLKAAGKGDGNHAFALPAPVSLKDGRTHSIHAKIGEAGSSWEVIGSPKEINCPRR
jgi:hypothetical protein